MTGQTPQLGARHSEQPGTDGSIAAIAFEATASSDSAATTAASLSGTTLSRSARAAATAARARTAVAVSFASSTVKILWRPHRS